MNQEPREPDSLVEIDERPGSYDEYAASEQRRVLFRVLASNLVRELLSSGYHARDLLGFVAQLMESVSDTGLESGAEVGAPVGPARGDLEAAVTLDQWRRPTIEGNRVLLRPPVQSDRATLELWRKDELVQQSLAPKQLEVILEHLACPSTRDRIDLLACDVVTREPFGAVSLFRIEAEVGQSEVAKMIGDPAYRGKGLAGAATALLLRYAFEDLGLNRVYLRTLGGNLKNIRLNERIGFKFEGVLRSAVVRRGRLKDVVLMGLLRREFEDQLRAPGNEDRSLGGARGT